MTTSELNIIGLSLDIIGVIILFFFGLPPRIKKGGTINLILEQTDNNEDKKWKIYDFISKLGLLLIIIGFSIQLYSNYKN